MSTSKDPNPPSRKEEDFPKTTTLPDGWVMDSLMEVYNRTGSTYDRGVEQPMPVPMTGAACPKTNGKAHDEAASMPSAESESLFTRRLEPFPSAADLTGMWL
jgi:hypothetical protein